MSKIIHTIRVYDKKTDRCHVIFGEDKNDVITRAKAACDAPELYEVEQWRLKGNDPTAEHGTYISGYTATTI